MNYSDAFFSPITNKPIPEYTRGYSTNNIYAGVPPLMTDGRAVAASYQPESFKNDDLIKESGVKSNWEYRQYLIHNAVSLMERNFEESANDVGFFDQRNTGLVQRPVFSGQHDVSDLKKLYLSRDDLAERFAPRVLTQEELLGLQ